MDPAWFFLHLLPCFCQTLNRLNRISSGTTQSGTAVTSSKWLWPHHSNWGSITPVKRCLIVQLPCWSLLSHQEGDFDSLDCFETTYPLAFLDETTDSVQRQILDESCAASPAWCTYSCNRQTDRHIKHQHLFAVALFIYWAVKRSRLRGWGRELFRFSWHEVTHTACWCESTCPTYWFPPRKLRPAEAPAVRRERL